MQVNDLNTIAVYVGDFTSSILENRPPPYVQYHYWGFSVPVADESVY